MWLTVFGLFGIALSKRRGEKKGKKKKIKKRKCGYHSKPKSTYGVKANIMDC